LGRVALVDEREKIIELELSIDELVDAALGIKHAQGFDLNIDLHSIDVDDVALPTVKLSGAKCHASLLSRSYQTTLYILVLMNFLVFKS
jgi:hypothetical protein